MLSPPAPAPPVWSRSFARLERIIQRRGGPLRIGCKVSVMVTRSGVVLDDVTRWKWVKEIGNHQYAPCVNWRRSWFMAPGSGVHTCWIYSFTPPVPLCRLAQGQVRVPFAAAHPHHHAVCGTGWWTALSTAHAFSKWIERHLWADARTEVEGGEETSHQIPAELVRSATCGTHLPLSVFHHLITHVRLSVPLFTCRLRQRQGAEGRRTAVGEVF